MQKKIIKILEKYKQIEFVYNEDKQEFLKFLNLLAEKIKKNNNKNLNSFVQILEYNFLEYSKFDTKILYNPVELINSILEKDFFWEKINNLEYKKIIKNFVCFEKYLDWELKEKNFLEKKYNIKIDFITENVASLNAEIYWKWLENFSEIRLIKILKKLLNFYPINFIKNIKLEKIIIVDSFYKEDIFWKTIHLWWFETYSNNNIYLSKNNLKYAFHHELFHQAMQYYNDFDKWWDLRENQDKKYLYENSWEKTFWFARKYWKENISEDQATIAEELILNFKNLHRRIEIDKKLRQKVELVKKAYYELSDWIMDEKWWENKMN